MKRVFSIALVFALCVGLTGCMRNAGPVQSANIPLPTVFESAAMETPAAEPAQETAKTPAVEEVPAQAAAEGAQARLEQAAVPPDGLTAYYPWERVPLPGGCELITVWNKQNGSKYLGLRPSQCPRQKRRPSHISRRCWRRTPNCIRRHKRTMRRWISSIFIRM